MPQYEELGIKTVKGTNDDGSLNVNAQLTGSSIQDTAPLPIKNTGKVTIDTIVLAQSVVAGGNTGIISLGVTTESEMWLQVNIDQQPWILNVGAVNDLGGTYSNTVYPSRGNMTTTFPNAWAPATSLYLGLDVSANIGLTSPANMTEARNYLIRPKSGLNAKITNNGPSVATVTLKVIRIWR